LRGVGPHTQLAHEFQHAGSQVLAAIQGLSEERMSTPAIDGWSVKDHLNHMTVWHEFRFHEIGRVARGGRPAFPPFTDEQLETVNSITVALRRHLPLAQALADLEFARSLVVEAIAGCPEDALREDAYGEAGLRGGIAHDLDHAMTITAWREREGI